MRLLRMREWAASLVAVVAVATLAVPSVAYAGTGSVSDPVVVSTPPWSSDATGTLLEAMAEDGPYGQFNWAVPLVKGRTYTFTLTTPNDDAELSMFGPAPNFSGQVRSEWGGDLDSDWDSEAATDAPSDPGIQILTFMAPRTATYSLCAFGDRVETFTVSAQSRPAVRYWMSGFKVPPVTKRKKKFSAQVTLSYNYDSFGLPIRFFVQRKVGRRWRSYAAPRATDAYLNDYSVAFRIKRAGTYRIRAMFSDVAHSPKYTSWRKFRIK